MTTFPFRSALLAAAIVVGLAACSDEPEQAETTASPPPAEQKADTMQAKIEAAKAAAPEDMPLQPPPSETVHTLDEARPMKQLTSADAPFACDVVTPEQVAMYLGPNFQIADITADRKNQTMSPVTSTCLLYEGKDPATMTAGVIIDIWTEADVIAAGHRGIDGVWTHRASEHARRLEAIPDAWAAWVDSEHAPDRALLVRQGEVMFELISQPFQSSADAPAVPQDKIEQLAIEVVRNAATDDSAPAAAPAPAAETPPAG